MKRFLSALVFMLGMSLLSLPVLAIDWNEPEAIREDLARKNRRILRFSGNAEPGAKIRIKNNRIRIRSFKRGSRWRTAKLPLKLRRLFPVKVKPNGTFYFDLYLPVAEVWLPVQIFRGGGWVSYNLKVKVPKAGSSYEVESIEDNFLETGDEYLPPRTSEQPVQTGLEPDRSGGRDAVVLGQFSAWAGLGFNVLSHDSTNSNSQTADASFSGLGFPDWVFGAEARFFRDWLITTNVQMAKFKFEQLPALSLDNDEFNYLNFDLGTSYRPKNFRLRWGVIGADVGIYYTAMPLVVQRQFGFTAHSIESNDYFSVYGGMSFQTKPGPRVYSGFARVSVPITNGSAYNIDSGIGFHGEGGVYFKISSAWYLGGFVNLSYTSSDISFDVTGNSGQFTGSHSLLASLITARFKTDF